MRLLCSYLILNSTNRNGLNHITQQGNKMSHIDRRQQRIKASTIQFHDKYYTLGLVEQIQMGRASISRNLIPIEANKDKLFK